MVNAGKLPETLWNLEVPSFQVDQRFPSKTEQNIADTLLKSVNQLVIATIVLQLINESLAMSNLRCAMLHTTADFNRI